jgi:isopenicillin N synthase-like dioxygenase
MFRNIFFLFTFSFASLFSNIPILNLEQFTYGDLEQQKEFVSLYGQALSEYGFVLIENHSISKEIIDKAYDSAKDFFSLPLETKLQYANLQINRGYKPYNKNREDKKSDLQEYWHVGSSIYGNVWPATTDEFENDLSLLYNEISESCLPLLEAASLYMNKESDFLFNFTQKGDSIMRVIHYLPSEEPSVWKAPHKDPNLLTIIVGASSEGLELQMKDGRWISVPFVQDAIIVSCSNMLESLSNGLLRSAPHRVVMPVSGISRYSIPFFYHGQRNLSIAPLSECIEKTGGVALYPDRTVEEALEGHHWFPN